MFRSHRGKSRLIAKLIIPLIGIMASRREAAVRLGRASSVWSEDDENKGQALASMLVKLLNDLALRAKKLQNIGPGLKIIKKYEKNKKNEELGGGVENLAPGPKLRLRPAAALLWVSGGRPLCAGGFRPPGGRFGGVSARGRCVACGLWLPGARFVGVGGRRGAASWGWPGSWVFFALGCGRRAWLGPGFFGGFRIGVVARGGRPCWVRAGGGRWGDRCASAH